MIDKMLPAGRGVAVARTLARRGLTRRRCATALLLAGISGSAFSAPQGLLKPAQLIVDSGLPPATRVANEYVARQYAT
ncbi:ester cyclase, partial [Acinetobacter baumannii]|nr:ester cyclase [Acinetobacter baumannii]